MEIAMSNTVAATGLTVKQWDDEFFVEYVQDNMFSRYMGTDENSIIQVKEDLTKKKGDTIHFALVNRLKNDAVLDNNTLVGNEEKQYSRSHPLTVRQRRNAVVVPAFEEQKSAINLRRAGKTGLKTWAMEDTRDMIIEALGDISGVPYASASEGQKDAWLALNSDRVLFGAAKGNNAANDHSAALANIDNTADKFLPASLSLMKRLATATRANGFPKITPITVEGGKRFFVAFAGPLTFRDFKNDSTITAAQRETVIKMQNIKLFEGGDQEWDGIIVHEVDDIPVYTGVGAGGIDVSPVYLCGAQALGQGWAKRWQSVEDQTDYGDKQGIGIRGWMDIDKLRFGTGADDTDSPIQHGVVTGYFASVADA
jgi:N4-gp56 family major capsid protein